MSSTSTADAATTRLAELPVLLVDCQTTGSSPARGHVLEVAWASMQGGVPAPVTATFVALPDGERLPPRITALTGISEEHLDGAPDPACVWARFVEATAGAAVGVAHFARFERAFLEGLHGTHGSGAFPLPLLCTHEIACRLLPGLPRRGLKALAGHLGLVLGETKRAAAHVDATARVWAGLVDRLERDAGVATLEDLDAWMGATAAVRRGGREFPVPRGMRLELPDAPGVYRMLGRGGEVLYVGKATSLKRRVNGYFQKRRHDRALVPEMLTQAFSIDTTRTATPLEAALLEVDEIKHHAPPYNRALRERRDAVVFADLDLRDPRPEPTATHRIGPLASAAEVATLRAALDLLGAETSADDTWRRALDLADEVRPEPALLDAALALVHERRPLLVPAGPATALVSLCRVGRTLWQEWQAAREADREADPETDAEALEQHAAGPWSPATPEEAAAALEAVLRRGAWALRRGRWLRRLVECTFAWRPATQERWRYVTFEDGCLVRADDLAPGGDAPCPAGWPRSRLRRLGAFDQETFDRLRVLTAELKRVCAAGADLRLVLHPRVHLDRPALARRLRWI